MLVQRLFQLVETVEKLFGEIDDIDVIIQVKYLVDTERLKKIKIFIFEEGSSFYSGFANKRFLKYQEVLKPKKVQEFQRNQRTSSSSLLSLNQNQTIKV